MRVLVLGCSYGLLPAMRMALTGHQVTMVGRADEIAAMRREDLQLVLPDRRGGAGMTLKMKAGDGITLTVPDLADAVAADLVILAMQEPQYADPGVAALMARIASANLPCLAIMNLPPPPFLARLGITGAALDRVFASAPVWRDFAPGRVTVASPDPQAVRLDPDRPGELTVTLASNFKVAPFETDRDQALLVTLAKDWSAFKHHGLRPPVHLLAQRSVHVPLAKWPMLITGNCRCLTDFGIRSIAEAVHSDLAASERLYAAVLELALVLGATSRDLVSFADYARASKALIRPSSLARALAGGAREVERIDLLVLQLMAAQGLDTAGVAPISDRISEHLSRNRATAAAL